MASTVRFRRVYRAAACCAFAGLLVPALVGQEPPAEEKPLVLRLTTRLVQLTVVVVDKKGRPVADLTREDFAVVDEGKRQEVRVFNLESRQPATGAAAPLPSGVFSNRREAQPGVTVILLDMANTRFADRASARRHLIQFLLQIQPRDRVAVYALGRELKVIHDFTEEPEVLLKALTTYLDVSTPELPAPNTGMAGPPRAGADARLGEPEATQILERIASLFDAENFFLQEGRRLLTYGALEAIANHLAGVPGRKNLVWLTGSANPYGGDPRWSARSASRNPRMGGRRPGDVAGGGAGARTAMLRAARALNAAGVAVYPVDASGLTTDPGQSYAIYGEGMMKYWAQETGGKAYYYRNDVMNAIREAVEDAQVAYTLGYYPSEQKLDGGFRRIRVKVNRTGVAVRHRSGYYDSFYEDSVDPAAREAVITDAIWSPVDATAIAVEARLSMKDSHEPETLVLHLKVDLTNITLEQRLGRWSGKFDMVLVQTDEDGNGDVDLSERFRIELEPEAYEKARKEALLQECFLRRRAPATALRILIRDAASGSMGRVIIPYNKAGV